MPKNCYDEKEILQFNPWRPVNQLPYPAVAGQILLTKSDFIMPARPDLLEWKKIEEVIGVYDVSMEVAEDGLSATFYKIVNLEKIAIGTIGIISRENAEKLDKANYSNYELVADADNHEMKFYGIDKDGESHLVGDVISYVSMLDINRLDNLIATETAERTAEVERLDNLIATETAERTADIERLDNITTALINDITILKDRATDLENNQDNVILPIINILRTATNPELVLVKDSDGVGIRWANRLGIDGVEIQENATNNVITFYQLKNGVRQQIGQIDKFNYQDFETWKRILEGIADDLNESSESGYILAKLADGNRYDWQDLNDLFSFEKIEGNILDTITIKINNNSDRQFTFKVINENKLNDILTRLGVCENKITAIETIIGNIDISTIGDTITEALKVLEERIDNIEAGNTWLWQGTEEELQADFENIKNGTFIAIEEV